MKKYILIILVQLPLLFAAQQAVRKIFLVGDSTVTNYRGSDYPMAGWGQVLQHFISGSDFIIENRAIGGRSSRSFIQEGRWNSVKAELNTGDFVMVQFGHNDRDWSKDERYTSPADYKNYLKQYVNEARALGAIPVLVTPMVLNAWRNGALRNVFTESGAEYVQRMKEVAQELNVPLIDLNQKSWDFVNEVGVNYATRFIYNTYLAGEYPNYPNGLNDYTHFQEMGALQMAKFVSEGISELNNHSDVGDIASKLRPLYNVSISANYPEAGTITRSVSLPEGVTVMLKSLTNNGHTFLNWKNANNQTLSANNIHTFTLSAQNASYKAFFDDDIVTDCAGVSGGTAVLDQCGICTGGTTGQTACTSTIQAEEFCTADGVLEASNTGFLGEGYFNQNNTQGASSLWTIVSETEQSVTIAIRYANGSAAARSMDMRINGASVSTFQGNATGSWTSWKDETFTVNLQKGANTLELVSTTASGGPNIDLFSFTAEGISKGSCEEDCNGDFGGLAYQDNCNECVGGATEQEACTQDCMGAWGGTAYTDACDRCVDGVTITEPCKAIMELEDACTIDGVLENTNTGYSGTGYANTDNASGTGLDFKLNATKAGVYSLWIMYANGSENARSAKIIVNEAEQLANVTFIPTASWATWKTQELNVSLEEGENTIQIEAITNEGAANLDYVSVIGEEVTAQPCVITSFLNDSPINATQVFPNPSKSQFTLELPVNSNYQVYNMNGTSVLEGYCEGRCYLGKELPKGTYLLQIEHFDKREIIKIIKE